jgi:Tol biopolymer transport system component
MKRNSLLLVATLTAASLAAQNKTPEAALGAALHQEEAQGDLNGAIAAYQKLLGTRGLNHKIAAEALYHLGLCHQKLGDMKARQAFERLVNEYGDTTWAAQARTKLAGLGSRLSGRQTTTVVWSGGKVDAGGSISPDGRYLSYPDWHTGNLGIHDVQTGADRDLTTDGSWKRGEVEFAEDSAISRDGKQAAYAWYQGKPNRFELRITNLTAESSPRKIFESAEMRYVSPQDWSPDGKWIAVSLEPENSDARTGEPVRPGMRATLGLVGVQDGSLRVIRTVGWHGPDTGFGKIQFSPDGKYLAYDRPATGMNRQRSTFALELGSDREIQVAAGHSQFMGWSADGKHLLFVSSRTGTNGLWAIRFVDGAPQGDAELIKPDIGQASGIGLSASGALYYYSPPARDLQHIQIAKFDPATWTLQSPPATLAEEDELEETLWPEWSPDGKALAYISKRPVGRGSETSIKIRSVDSGETREVRPQGHPFFYAVRWAPDGLSLLIGAPEGLYRVDARSGESSLVLKGVPGFNSVHWALSTDQRTLYYKRDKTSPNADMAFVERDLASGKEREIIRRPFLGGLGLTPDTRYIATASFDPTDHAREFMIIPVAGGTPRDAIRVTGEAENLAHLHYNQGWLRGVTFPDNRSTIVRKRFGDGDQDLELWEVFMDGSPARKFDGKVDPGLLNVDFRRSPDGRQIVGTWQPTRREKAPGQIVMLENYLPAKAGNAAAR